MNKTASILTPPRDHLSPALFDSQNNLRSDFREFLIKRFKNLYPQLEVTGMFIIGSITSLQ
jgi:peptidoglycan/LPS O-acetylase OafA/YrhL